MATKEETKLEIIETLEQNNGIVKGGYTQLAKLMGRSHPGCIYSAVQLLIGEGKVQVIKTDKSTFDIVLTSAKKDTPVVLTIEPVEKKAQQVAEPVKAETKHIYPNELLKDAILKALQENGVIEGYSKLGKLVGKSKSNVYVAVQALVKAGKVTTNTKRSEQNYSFCEIKLCDEPIVAPEVNEIEEISQGVLVVDSSKPANNHTVSQHVKRMKGKMQEVPNTVVGEGMFLSKLDEIGVHIATVFEQAKKFQTDRDKLKMDYNDLSWKHEQLLKEFSELTKKYNIAVKQLGAFSVLQQDIVSMAERLKVS